jgi:hypothetical protein
MSGVRIPDTHSRLRNPVRSPLSGWSSNVCRPSNSHFDPTVPTHSSFRAGRARRCAPLSFGFPLHYPVRAEIHKDLLDDLREGVDLELYPDLSHTRPMVRDRIERDSSNGLGVEFTHETVSTESHYDSVAAYYRCSSTNARIFLRAVGPTPGIEPSTSSLAASMSATVTSPCCRR